jgi:hypothetical protein
MWKSKKNCIFINLKTMKLPAANFAYLERNCAEALPATALTGYGAAASPFFFAQAAGYFGEGE